MMKTDKNERWFIDTDSNEAVSSYRIPFSRNICTSTGLLSRYLQRVDVDFRKAVGMVERAIDMLNELRKQPERIITYVEQKHNSPDVTWQQSRVKRQRQINYENAEDEPAETPEE